MVTSLLHTCKHAYVDMPIQCTHRNVHTQEHLHHERETERETHKERDPKKEIVLRKYL